MELKAERAENKKIDKNVDIYFIRGIQTLY